MLKMMIGLLYALICNHAQAQEHLFLPQSFTVTKYYHGLEKQIRIENKSQTFAYLSQNTVTPQTYHLYCPQGHLVAHVEHRELNQIHYFDIYNAQYDLIAMAQESIITSKPYFIIYDPNQRTPIANAIMNRLRTYFEVIEPQSKKQLLTASTTLKSQGLNWQVLIKDPLQLQHIDTITLFSILSLQTDLWN